MAYVKVDWDWLRCHLGGLSGSSVKVLLVLLTYKPDENGHCWPSQETIAQIAGLRTRTVKRAIGELTQAGWVTTVRRPYHASRYVIHPHVRCTPQAERIPTDGKHKR